jgi:cellulose synthase/poly-beta-1,6-N-acetylglucosamine synthase-like glycosyltransferase
MTPLLERPLLSVVIKALNEEDKIAAALQSVLAATEGLDAEVILADALSTDRTVEVAKRYPIRIVEMCHTTDRGCGATAQLGWEAAQGRFLLLMDGDMELVPTFPHQALEFLEKASGCAGVKGQLEEMSSTNFEFRRRKTRASNFEIGGDLLALEGGGLYRREAIESVGYFADKNLRSFEELDLGLRLHDAGWTLAEMPEPAVRHYSHAVGDIEILRQRASSGYLVGIGQLVRAHPGKLVSLFHHLRILRQVVLATFYALLLLIGTAVTGGAGGVALLVVGAGLPIVAYWLRKKSLRDGVLSFLALGSYVYGLFSGLFLARRDPMTPIPHVEVGQVLAVYSREGI